MKPLRVIVVEDNEDDALLLALELRRGGWEPDLHRVQTPEGLRAALAAGPWDVVISDYAMPRFNGLEALRIVNQVGAGELPFLLVSGTIGEESAVEALKAGAGDFVVKQNLSRLVPAVEREMRDAQVRRERRESMEALRQAVAARDKFLSIASHELKTPLTSLQLQLQSVLRLVGASATGDERLLQKLRTVTRATERLGELVNRLLDVSRITAGTLEIVREDMDLSELAREVGSRFGEVLREAGSDLDLRAPLPVRGRWDRMRIDTIVTNLLSNAVKYGQGKPVELGVAASGASVRLWVKDQGIGIAPEDQARIFERFERAVPERHYGGFGVGLWVARLVAEAHGGSIRVESAPGLGSTFALELSRERCPAAARCWWSTTTATSGRPCASSWRWRAGRWRWPATAPRRSSTCAPSGPGWCCSTCSCR
jgi:signal transduction histidine kinase